MKNKNGFSFIEVIVASGVLAVVIYIFGSGSTFLSGRNKDLEELLIMERHVNSLYENIQSNIDIYQITYDPKSFNDNSDPRTLSKYLPLVWDMNVLTSIESCPDCPGRMGFIIVPLNGYRGLYKLTIRVTHPNVPDFKDFFYLINGK